jgi:hypothetical protein
MSCNKLQSWLKRVTCWHRWVRVGTVSHDGHGGYKSDRYGWMTYYRCSKCNSTYVNTFGGCEA